MTSSNSKTAVMDQIIERAIEQNPHSRELLKAFGPVMTKQRELSESVILPPLDYSAIDREKLHAGVSVIRQISLFSPDDPLTGIAMSLIAAVKEGMPALAEGLERLSDLISQNKLHLTDYFTEGSGDKNGTIAGQVSDFKILSSNASFLMSLMTRVLLERRAREISKALGEFAWEKGYCPVCGEFPSIALIEEEGGKRFLHCSSCGMDWRFTRVICPYCEKEAQQGMDYFYVENRTQESAFVCDKCKRYLITLYRAGHLLARDMDISAISLVHLDMIMQDKGYEPMVVCVWNMLK